MNVSAGVGYLYKLVQQFMYSKLISFQKNKIL